MKKFKRLFYDIEVSPNICFTWNVGRKISIDYNSIIQERAIICVCYKYEGEKQVHELHWNNGDDKELLIKFAQILNNCDESIGHNSDNFDAKWIRTRCLKYGIPLDHDLNGIDTLKLSRKGFRFNSNRLDYIAQYLGIPGKIKTEFNLWKDITLFNKVSALNKMITYCKHDVITLERIFQKLNPYIKSKSNKGNITNSCSCPECGSNNSISNGTRILASGLIKRRLHCQDCGKYYSISEKKYQDGRK